MTAQFKVIKIDQEVSGMDYSGHHLKLNLNTLKNEEKKF